MKTSQVKQHKGFSLIEVLIAILVMGFGIIAIAKLHTFMIQDSGFSNEQTIAVSLAEGKLEELRAYASIDNPDVPNYAAITSPVDDGWVEEQVTEKSITFNRKWRVNSAQELGLESDFKEVEVEVSWTDAAGRSRSIQAASVIAGVSPASMLGILRNFAPTGNLVQPFNRILKVPIPAIDTGKGTSIYTPPGNDGIEIHLDNITGEVTDESVGIPWTFVDGKTNFLLSGYVNVAGQPAEVISTLQFRLVGLNDEIELTASACWSDSATFASNGDPAPAYSGFVTYSCVVQSNTTKLVGDVRVPAWSGRLRLGINDGTANNNYGWKLTGDNNLTGNNKEQLFSVCRYQLTEQEYVEVTETMANQNFVMLDNTKPNSSCPDGSVQFQP